jgi:peptidoglycan/xylan/chitin deacetylase (PgdA/CDA1 family)
MATHRLALSVDLDEWYHSRRWIDGEQKNAVPDTIALFRRVYGADVPAGEIVAPTRMLLDLLDRHGARCTFFVLGEMAQWYPELVCELAARGHEIACHGLHHVDMSVLGPDRFEADLAEASAILESATGQRPVGFRAPNLVYEPWATRILEKLGFEYDSTVCVSRPIGGKYRGWSSAPLHPYHPSYDDIARPGTATLVEVPLPCFPYLRFSAGSGIMTRLVGYHWTSIALRATIRSGDTSYYFHPWELARKPPASQPGLRGRLFFRRSGPWMARTVERILKTYDGRIVPVRECAAAERLGVHGRRAARRGDSAALTS